MNESLKGIRMKSTDLNQAKWGLIGSDEAGEKDYWTRITITALRLTA